MHLHALLAIIALNCCHYHASANYIKRDVNQHAAIASIVRQHFAGRIVIGDLCWNTERIKQLSGILASDGTYFRNKASTSSVDGTSGNHVLLADSKCNNWLHGQAITGDVLFVDDLSCDDLEVSFNAPADFFVINEDKVVKCMRSKSRDRYIDVVYIASPETVKNIKDFRRNLNNNMGTRFNHQLFNEIFTFLNITPKTSFVPSIPASTELVALPVPVPSMNRSIYTFLSTRTPSRASFLLRAPTLSSVSNVFTLPLELKVWYASYVLLAILLLTLFAIVRMEWRYPDMVANRSRIMRDRLADVVHMNVGAIAQQGSEAEPASGGGRIATFLAFLFFLFLYTSYSANIVALLGSTTTRVHGVRDLQDFGVRLGVDSGGFSRASFANETSAAHQALYGAKLARDDSWMSFDEGVRRIRGEFFAFYADNDLLYKTIDELYMDNEKCGFVEIPFLSDPEKMVPIRKDSVHKEILKIGLGLFLERGLHNRIKRIMFAKQPQCYTGGSNFVSVSLMDCYFAFVIYVGGALMASIIFGLELLIARFYTRKISQLT